MRLLVALAVVLPTLAFGQVPARIGYQGRLLKADGTPEGGIVKLSFAIHSAATGGSPIWSEDQDLAMTDGFYSTFLGDVKPLTGGVFDGAEKFLEIAVRGVALAPRQRIGSVPYALAAHHVLGGKVDASSVSVNGKTVIDGGGKLVGTAAYGAGPGSGLVIGPKNALSLLDVCKKDEVLRFDGTEWKCALVEGKSYTAPTGSGLTISAANAVSLLTTCAKNEVLKWSGTAWACAPDEDAPYREGPGINVDSTTRAIKLSACLAGQILKSSATGADWTCASDQNSGGTITAVTAPAAGGLSASGSPTAPALGLKTCASGEILKSETSGWACAADANSGGTLTGLTAPAEGGLVTGGAASAPTLGLKICASGEILKYGSSGWACSQDASGAGTVTSVSATAGGGLITGGTSAAPALGLKACGSGEVLKYGSTGWTCSPDSNSGGTLTGLSATPPLAASISGTVASISISQASSATNGFLSSADWSTFNAKLAAVSVSAPLVGAGTSASPLGLPTASATSNGFLSSANWTTFNNKVTSVSAGTGVAVTGTPQAPTVGVVFGATAGTAAQGNDARLSDGRAPTAGSGLYIQNQTASAQAASFNVLGSGAFGASLGVGTASPSEKLEVAGNIKWTGDTLQTKTLAKISPFYLRGTGLNNSAEGVAIVGSTTLHRNTCRGLTLAIVVKATHAATSTCYDTHGDATASNNLAVALNGLTSAHLGILTSYDAWEGAITTNLRTQFLRLELFKAYATPTSPVRRPYAAVFESAGGAKGSARAIEVLRSTDANQPHAEVRGWLVDGSFVASGDVPSALVPPSGETAAVVVDEAGNVGVGTTTPTQKLDVAGILRFSGNYLQTAALTRVAPLSVRGTGANQANANAQVILGSATLVNNNCRGLTLTVFNKLTLGSSPPTCYDTYGSTAASDQLAVALNSLNNTQLGVLTSYDAWEGNVSGNLRTAFLRLGLYKAYATAASPIRQPYAAVFEAASGGKASGRAVEVLRSGDANQPTPRSAAGSSMGDSSPAMTSPARSRPPQARHPRCS